MGEFIFRNRYKVESILYAGKSSVVYKVADIRFPGKFWVVREYELKTKDEVVKNFIIDNFNEILQMWSSISHKNIVKLVDYFVNKNKFYIVTDFVYGDSIENLLNKYNRPFSQKQVLGWALQLIDLLKYLRAIGLNFYIDLLPSNLMIDRTGIIKLVDFGISRLFKNFIDVNENPLFFGKIAYTAPELLDNDFSQEIEIEETAYVYVIAVLMYQMLTLRDPMLSSYVYMPASSLNPEITICIEKMLTKALDNNPVKRFASLKLFKIQILNCTKDFEIDKLTTTVSKKTKSTADYSFKGFVWLVSAFFLGIFLFFLFYIFFLM